MWRPAAFKAAAFLGCAVVSNCGCSLGFVSSEGHRCEKEGKREREREGGEGERERECMCISVCKGLLAKGNGAVEN